MLSTDQKQLSIKDDGQICWQQDPTNPLPGVPVARVVKGETPLSPGVEILPELGLAGEALEAALIPIREWLSAHIARVLEPLVKLTMVIENTPAPVQGIVDRVYAGLGIVPRDDVTDLIAGLDTDMRKTLRGRHIRLGPVLVFVPDLNKPAAVRLRALLWTLYQDLPLPAPVPRDGAVSQIIDPIGANADFYRAIGYPLYGNRVIRIDMLDRVMNAIYEGVKDNQFQAKHQMAEWLGCSVPDLYVVLEAMGHKKLHDPAEKPMAIDNQAAEELAKVIPVDETKDMPPAPAVILEATATAAEPETDDAPTTAEQTPTVTDPAANAAPTARPELATFRVWWPRKGGAKASNAAPRARTRAPKPAKTPPPFDMLTPEEMAERAAAREARERARTKGRGTDEGNASDQGPGRRGSRQPDGAEGGAQGGKRVGRNVGRQVGGFGRDMGSGGGGSKSKQKTIKLDKGLRLAANAGASTSQANESPFAILSSLKLKSE